MKSIEKDNRDTWLDTKYKDIWKEVKLNDQFFSKETGEKKHENCKSSDQFKESLIVESDPLLNKMSYTSNERKSKVLAF